MNTQPNPKFSIKAKYLGPVFKLDEELTKNAQNLIFARNGTGKSFLSRAFRYLDLHRQGCDISEASRDLVSDESVDGTGNFSFHRGSEVLGSMQLKKGEEGGTIKSSDTLFHVFSEDFVQEELRENKFEIDGKIENQIAIDSDEIKLKTAKDAVIAAQKDIDTSISKLRTSFEEEKVDKLSKKASVYKQLKEYKSLDLDRLLQNTKDKPQTPDPSFSDILKSLDQLKSLPSEPSYPEDVPPFLIDLNILTELRSLLKKETSPSTVSEQIKQRIEDHNEFYKSGLEILKVTGEEKCPFCIQSLVETEPATTIAAYLEYFSDEEEKHKNSLRTIYKNLNSIEHQLIKLESDFGKQNLRHTELKRFIQSQKNSSLRNCEDELVSVRTVIVDLKKLIEDKANNLTISYDMSSDDLTASVDVLSEIIKENNEKCSVLVKAIERSDEERKSLQRSACSIFEQEFVISNWTDIESHRDELKTLKTKTEELKEVEKLSPKSNARARVADTFEQLLHFFFAEKYVFEKETFILKRGEHEMSRGPHRTLSDGEKTAIAFCHFIASIHKKVKANSDYQHLFLVFDDPVTSMSYDFVFAIAQTLKNLNISHQGDISLNPADLAKAEYSKPNLLVLTHSSYFFNISRTNKVVKDDAAFALQSNKTEHTLSKLCEFVAPFKQQLKEVHDVAEGGSPDCGTGNAIRSVLEAIGRFCRPDKSKDLSSFITFLAGEEGMEIKSVMINNLSHGTFYDETPSPDDIRNACKETIEVVRKYAAGQLELIGNNP